MRQLTDDQLRDLINTYMRHRGGLDVKDLCFHIRSNHPVIDSPERIKSMARQMGLIQTGPDTYIQPAIQATPYNYGGISTTTYAQVAPLVKKPKKKKAVVLQAFDMVKVVDNGKTHLSYEGLALKFGATKFQENWTPENGTTGQIIAIISETGMEGLPIYLIDFGDNQALISGSGIAFLKKGSLLNKKIELDSVVMSDEKKEEIRAAISQLKNTTTIFDDWGFSEVFEKGTAISLLFYGIPGTGKTLTAQAIADEVGGELKIYSTAEIESSEPGGAERTMKQIFATAKQQAKKGKQEIILFDECDSLLTDRNELGPILGAQVNTLLGEIERYEGVIIFTTNRLGKLDPALERRITAKIEFEFPDQKQREAIWARMIPKKAPLHTDVNIKHLAEHALAGGNIKNAVLNAARNAAFKGDKKLKHEHFQQAIEREMKSLQAFVSAYEKTPHHSLAGYMQRTSTGITVGKKHVIQKDKAKWGGEN